MQINKVLILGVTGMLGHTLFEKLSRIDRFTVFATSRTLKNKLDFIPNDYDDKIIQNVDANHFDSVLNTIQATKPTIVINCIGIIKQLPDAKDPITSITINALFPHQLASACKSIGARLIHFSTDCVFSGKKGNYIEDNFPDADDLYGRTKFLGELPEPHCVTLRTSIIGHELKSKHGLIDWFLNEKKAIKGYTRAIFCGLPTVEMAHIVADYVIPNEKLSGLYHVSSDPIAKYDLLKLVAERYGHKIEIEPYEDFACDRSLNSEKFKTVTGYTPPPWVDLVSMMHEDFLIYERR